MLLFWRNFHHWLHWKLSKWQLPVQPVMTISSKWRHFSCSEITQLSTIEISLEITYQNFIQISQGPTRSDVLPGWVMGCPKRVQIFYFVIDGSSLVQLMTCCVFWAKNDTRTKDDFLSTGGRLNKKDRLTGYGDPHVKDKTSYRPSYL